MDAPPQCAYFCDPVPRRRVNRLFSQSDRVRDLYNDRFLDTAISREEDGSLRNVMKIAIGLTHALEMKTAQLCALCGQEITTIRQRPFNIIMIDGYDMCPSCHQDVPGELQNDLYRINWHLFTKNLRPDS